MGPGSIFAFCAPSPPGGLGSATRQGGSFFTQAPWRCAAPCQSLARSDLATLKIPTPFASCLRTLRSVALGARFDRLPNNGRFTRKLGTDPPQNQRGCNAWLQPYTT